MKSEKMMEILNEKQMDGKWMQMLLHQPAVTVTLEKVLHRNNEIIVSRLMQSTYFSENPKCSPLPY